MKVMPNQVIAHRTPADAWRWACGIINTYGDKVITEDRKLTKEVRNLMVQILEPGESWPIPGSGWDMPALEVYARDEILSEENKTGFSYTYGERIMPNIPNIIRKLWACPTSRRAITTTWYRCDDPYEPHPPCLIMPEFLFRDGKLHLSAIFRSWDVKQAAPANMYGLWKLLCYVAAEAGMEPGSLSIMAVSAHIYEV